MPLDNKDIGSMKTTVQNLYQEHTTLTNQIDEIKKTVRIAEEGKEGVTLTEKIQLQQFTLMTNIAAFFGISMLVIFVYVMVMIDRNIETMYMMGIPVGIITLAFIIYQVIGFYQLKQLYAQRITKYDNTKTETKTVYGQTTPQGQITSRSGRKGTKK